MPSWIHNQSLTAPFDWDELDKVIRILPRKKSLGHDNILNEHIVYGGNAIKTLLLSLFNSVTLAFQLTGSLAL